MSHIPFIYARFFDENEGRHAIEQRLTMHLRKIRAKAAPLEGSDANEESDWEEENAAHDQINSFDRVRIHLRAQKIIRLRETASGLGHLGREDKDALQRLREGVNLVPIRTEAQADEIAARLHSAMPWMRSATTHLWHAMRRSAKKGEIGFRLPPLLLYGPPGIGKSVWARQVSEMLGVPLRTVEATGEQASFGVVGSQRGWGSAHPGKPLQTVMQHLVGNPVVVVDEIEKGGEVISTRGGRFGLASGLLPLLERATAKDWECPYYQVRFDMSWISWVLTANDISSLPEPFLTRIEALEIDAPLLSDLVQFATRMGESLALEPLAIEAILDAIEAAFARGLFPNLRTVNRMLDLAQVLQSLPVVH